MSVRGEQFWLDKTRAPSCAPGAAALYTEPSIVLPTSALMAIGSPARQPDQTILQRSRCRGVLARLVPEPARAFECRAPDACISSARSAAQYGLQQAQLSQYSRRCLQRFAGRGHDVARIRAFA